MNQLIAHLLENLILDFQGDLDLEMVREFLKDDDSKEAKALLFIDIQDWTGKIQLFVGKNQVGTRNWDIASCFDLGDLVGVDGELQPVAHARNPFGHTLTVSAGALSQKRAAPPFWTCSGRWRETRASCKVCAGGRSCLG